MHEMKTLVSRRLAALVALVGLTVSARSSEAIPAFARRYEMSCRTCHAYRFPLLSSFGKRFREDGYQLPEGAEDPVRARRNVEPGTVSDLTTLFREVPLSLRGQVFAVGRVESKEGAPIYENKIFSYLDGGGSVARDLSFFFSFTPFPATQLHQARIGIHDLGESWLGAGTLNVRAGALMLLDFQRPTHRQISPGGPKSATGVAVGANTFTLDNTTLGLELHGRPLGGPFLYELALVAGDPGATLTDRDDWKDGFARLSYTFFQNGPHELVLGAFGYLGRADLVTEQTQFELAQRDDFYIVGGDAELDVGPLNVFGTAYTSRHADARLDGEPVSFFGGRAEVVVGISDDLIASLRYDGVTSSHDETLRRSGLAPHLTWLMVANAALSIEWRQDLLDSKSSSGVALLDLAF
ncbi:MAG: hypothetical protein HY791_04685 [Deltaproteobacteria bacterium]|nr:hypothetical protein [Deltaproteobacteria bacterium]